MISDLAPGRQQFLNNQFDTVPRKRKRTKTDLQKCKEELTKCKKKIRAQEKEIARLKNNKPKTKAKPRTKTSKPRTKTSKPKAPTVYPRRNNRGSALKTINAMAKELRKADGNLSYRDAVSFASRDYKTGQRY